MRLRPWRPARRLALSRCAGRRKVSTHRGAIRLRTAEHVFYPGFLMNTFSNRLAYEPLHVQAAYGAHALGQMLRYISANAPFYKDLFARHHTDITDVKSLNDLMFLPFTTKEDMRERNWDFLCVPRREIREYTATSGTMGRPVT